MDEVKRAMLEQRMIAILLALLVVLLVVGPLRKELLSWLPPIFSRPPVPATAAPATSPSPLAPPSQGNNPLDDDRIIPTQPAPPVSSPRAPGGSDSSEASVTHSYTAQGLRDPLKSLLPEPKPAPSTPGAMATGQDAGAAQTPPPPPPALQVQGVVWGGEMPRAIINEHVYGIDDVIEGATIVSIDSRGVTLAHRGERFLYAPSATPKRVESLVQ